MTKDDRDKICKTCINHKLDKRYGVLCGITNNFAHFQDSCKDYTKQKVQSHNFETTTTKITKRREKSKFGVIGAGISLWLIFKLIMLLIKFFNT